ncbi:MULTISPECIES: aminoglycoside phosphotransferase family protein [unclassified Streptomyces]|uniref:aminoglycoside phosphotransferase family protein n=1 Tax=unclassified Streptomyces TaxID=2593676 RepID=UPI00225228EE|nr:MULTISPECIES: aminoglycoside phosphotransferase family protein [unclassified Streptomyces]MCX4528434.1 aminoglycoside phosphotransferase family protein [Streptomyces sp. NBC_01551]MCX4540967.1 aminoglycoside phosphotransferase family protein [Streptomyces sp. NBC_01565]
MAFEPPQRLVRALGETPESAQDADWLGQLPELTGAALARRGVLAQRVQAPGGRSSLLVLVRYADGTPAALKLAPPSARPDRELAALAHWGGFGAVRVLDTRHHADDGALLLERLHPEVSLRSLPEAKALLEACGTLRRLWVAPGDAHDWETVAERTKAQSEALRSAPAEVGALAGAALEAREELTAVPGEELLLHGNFRQGKVLAGERAPWLTVGPDPLVGERAYDLARLVRDRLEDQVASSAGAAGARRRVNKLADSLEVDRDRLRGWTLFRAVESGNRALAAGRRRDAELLLEFAAWL